MRAALHEKIYIYIYIYIYSKKNSEGNYHKCAKVFT